MPPPQTPPPCTGRTARPGAEDAASSPAGGIVVAGPRSLPVPPAASPGAPCEVQVDLLPLRPGVQRLPAFLVVGEADGRPLDSVHDVQLLVQ